MTRILVVNPNTSEQMTRTIAAALADFPDAASIDVKSVPWGPLSVESEVDGIVAASAVLETVWSARREYDAFVVACFDDPGVDGCRELVPQPVAGIGESAIGAASAAFQRVGVIVVESTVIPRVAAHCARNGVSRDRLIFGSLGGSVIELNSGGRDVADRFAAVADELITQRAECIVLACAGFSNQAVSLATQTGGPVFDGNRLAVRDVRRHLEGGYRNGPAVQPQPFTGARTSAPTWADAGNVRKEVAR